MKNLRRLGRTGVLAASLLVGLGTLIAGCASPPRTTDFHISVEPNYDNNGRQDGATLRLGGTITFGTSLFEGTLTTAPDGGHRIYHFELTSGPATGNEYKFADVYDAVSVMDQVLKDDGMDTSSPSVDELRNACKDWIISNLISADDFYADYGY